MVRAGVESVRLSFYWAPMQPFASWEQVPPGERAQFRNAAGVPTDFRATDRIVQLAAERGLALLPWSCGHPTGPRASRASGHRRPRILVRMGRSCVPSPSATAVTAASGASGRACRGWR